jgi:N4-gp56 family major capsid protein
MFSWDFDAPSGTYKNHKISNRLLETALENSVAMPYVDVQEDFGKSMGESMTFTRFTHIDEPVNPALNELSTIPEVAFSLSTHAITVTENGVAVPYTNKMGTLSKFDIDSSIQRTLMEQKRLVLDSESLTVMKSVNVKYVPTSATAASKTYNGTPSGTAVAALSYFHISDISMELFDNLRVPYWENDQYIGIFRAKTLATVRQDSQFVEWNKYTNAQAKAKGEIGTVERIRFIETNHSFSRALPDVGSNNFGSGVVFGRDIAAMVEAETPHLRAAIPTDFGRFRSIAWYGIYGFGLLFPGATTEATSRGVTRGLHVTSA